MANCETHIFILLIILSASTCHGLSDCSPSGSGGILFSITSKRNHTGHWNAQVHFRHGTGSKDDDRTESGAWDIMVKQTTEKCKEGDVVDLVATVAAPPPRAGPGYELVPGLGYYKLHITPKTWPEAREICRQEGGHLAIVNSEKELKALHGIFELHPKITTGWQNDNAYLGFHDQYVEGQYITVFGDSLESTGFAQFAPGEPTDKGVGTTGNDCGCVHRGQALHDVGCLYLLPFFCEQETF